MSNKLGSLAKRVLGVVAVGTAFAAGVLLMARNDEQQQSAQALHDVKQELPLPLLPVLGSVYSLDGSRLVVASGKDARLWEVATGKELQLFQGHAEQVLTVALSPDGKQVATGSGRGGALPSMDDSARVWDVATGKEIRRFEGHKGLVHTVQFSLDGKRLLTASGDGTARLSEIGTGRELFVLSGVYAVGLPAASVSFSFDGRTILGRTKNTHEVTLWDAHTGKVLTTIKRSKKGLFTSAVLDSSGTVILTALSDGTARTWDVNSGHELKVFRGHTSDFVNQAIFTADGRKVITASSDKTVRLWDANTGKETKRISYPAQVREVLVSRNGERLLAKWHTETELPVKSGITLTDTASGRPIMQYSDGQYIQIVGFTQDSKKFLVADEGTLASVWDANTGKMIRKYNR